jgi:MFS superfamily sulfate permease-like transporter
MAVVIAFTGGRPAMITAATGAIALVVAPLARDHGLEYLLAAVVLGGVFQILLAAGGVARLMRFIPRSVMVGFVNALAILIFTAQLPHLVDVPWSTTTGAGRPTSSASWPTSGVRANTSTACGPSACDCPRTAEPHAGFSRSSPIDDRHIDRRRYPGHR